MEPQQESSGDYGYDLAHDDVVRGRPPASAPEPHERSRYADGTADRGEDYGYDEAHGF